MRRLLHTPHALNMAGLAIRNLTPLKNDDGQAEMRELLPAQPLLKALPCDRYKDDGGGYDCEFLQQPPSGLQIECPV